MSSVNQKIENVKNISKVKNTESNDQSAFKNISIPVSTDVGIFGLGHSYNCNRSGSKTSFISKQGLRKMKLKKIT